MKKQQFNELLQSVKEAVAIQGGELRPKRVIKVVARSVNARTAHTLKASKAGRNVKRLGTKKELFADVGLILAGQELPKATAKDEAEVQDAIDTVRRRHSR